MIKMDKQSTDTTIPGSPFVSSSKKREALYEKFKAKISVNLALNRALVSFQGNKKVPFYN